jgi:hypothetical protein
MNHPRTLALFVLGIPTLCASAGWWQEVPATEEETEAIRELAEKELPPELSGNGFEFVRIEKQQIEYQSGDVPRKQGKSENLRFYGAFPDSLNYGDYRESYGIRCSIYTEYVESEVSTKRENCDQGVERFLIHEDVDSELRLDEVVELDLAKAFLGFLTTQIGPMRGRPLITQSDFSKFERIGIRRGRPERVVVYWSGGSTTYGISFEVEKEDGFTFKNMRDESYVDD